jgi:serine/threonine protein kinase
VYKFAPYWLYLSPLDLHTRNLVSTVPKVHSLSKEELLQKLKAPVIGAVRRTDGKPLEPGMPEYLVLPTYYPADRLSLQSVKIIDFGESFFDKKAPKTLNTPLVVRAPEVIFKDELDHHVDLWSMGCMV